MDNSIKEFQDDLNKDEEIRNMFEREREANPTALDPDVHGVSRYIQSWNQLQIIPAEKIIKYLPTPEMKLKHRNIGPAGAKALAEGLKVNMTVDTLDLEDNGLGEDGGIYIADMLCDNICLTELNISNNNIGSRGAEVFCDVMQLNSYLKILNLCGSGFKDRDAKFIATGIQANSTLQEIDLGHNNFSEYGAVLIGKALASNKTLQKFGLSWNSIRKKGAVGLCKGIKENTGLVSINLSWNGLAYEGALSLRDLLKNNQTLQCLDVSNNGINWDGALLIAQGLRYNASLKILKIGQNPLGMTGCMDILEAVSSRGSASVVNTISFEDIPVCKKILFLKDRISQKRHFTMTYGPVLEGEDVLGRRKVHRGDPLKLLIQFLSDRNIRVLELFRTFDQANIHVVTREQFIRGLKRSSVPLENFEITQLVEKLDPAKSGKISYKCLMDAVRRRLKNMREHEKEEQKKKSHRMSTHKRIMSSDNLLPDIKQRHTPGGGLTRKSTGGRLSIISQANSEELKLLSPMVTFSVLNRTDSKH